MHIRTGLNGWQCAPNSSCVWLRTRQSNTVEFGWLMVVRSTFASGICIVSTWSMLIDAHDTPQHRLYNEMHLWSSVAAAAVFTILHGARVDEKDYEMNASEWNEIFNCRVRCVSLCVCWHNALVSQAIIFFVHLFIFTFRFCSLNM